MDDDIEKKIILSELKLSKRELVSRLNRLRKRLKITEDVLVSLLIADGNLSRCHLTDSSEYFVTAEVEKTGWANVKLHDINNTAEYTESVLRMGESQDGSM